MKNNRHLIKGKFGMFILFALTLTLTGCNKVQTLTPAKLKPVLTKSNLDRLIAKGQLSRNSDMYYGVPEVVVDTGSVGGEDAPRDFTGTNEQVEGVSESDIIKTDGYQIYYLVEYPGEVRVFDVNEDHSITLNNTITLENAYPHDLYLLDDYLVVISSFYDSSYDRVRTPGLAMWFPYYYNYSTLISVIDRATYEVVYDLRVEDNILLDHRMIGDTLYLVGHQYFYAEEDNRPRFTTSDDEETYIEYDDIYYFDDTPALGLTKIVGLKLAANPADIFFTGTAYLGANYSYKQIYVTPTDLYISDTNYIYTDNEYYQTMTISQHALNLVEASTSFVAAGIVRGGMLNQFAMDYYDGYLRVATTEMRQTFTYDISGYITRMTSTVTNRLYILKVNLNDQNYNLVSMIDKGLGKPNETIRSVRFEKERAFIVTFLNTDPLYIIDLSAPEKPIVTDAMEQPGFDTYQHPWGEDYLIGLGQSATSSGQVTGIKISAYDTTAGSAETLDTVDVFTYITSELGMYGYGYSEGIWNHKALLVSVEDGVFGLPLYKYYWSTSYENEMAIYRNEVVSSYLLYRIDFANEFPILKLVEVTHPQYQEDYEIVNRSVLIESHVYIFSQHYITIYNLETDVILATILIEN
ncbi:MAG: beta-propeller domain-containing protein [Bacilli bacterium]